MNWQVNWKVWHFPWYLSSIDPDPVFMVGGKPLIANFAGIGPFQFHWYSY